MPDGRYITLQSSDFAVTIYGALDGAVETIYGDSVASIEETGQGVRVGFDHAPPREADLVTGADGLHSRPRQLLFGPDVGREVSLGYHVADGHNAVWSGVEKYAADSTHSIQLCW